MSVINLITSGNWQMIIVLYAKKFIGDEPFGVLLLGYDKVVNQGGDPCLKQMMDIYEKHDASVIGVMEVADSEVSRYGIVDSWEENIDKTWGVKELVMYIIILICSKNIYL